MRLIPSIRKLFWAVKKNTIFDARYKKEIIVKTLNYGKISDIQWLRKEFGKTEILKVVNMPRNGLREESIKLAKLMFG